MKTEDHRAPRPAGAGQAALSPEGSDVGEGHRFRKKKGTRFRSAAPSFSWTHTHCSTVRHVTLPPPTHLKALLCAQRTDVQPKAGTLRTRLPACAQELDPQGHGSARPSGHSRWCLPSPDLAGKPREGGLTGSVSMVRR